MAEYYIASSVAAAAAPVVVVAAAAAGAPAAPVVVAAAAGALPFSFCALHSSFDVPHFCERDELLLHPPTIECPQEMKR